ncbi:hypothetical protein COOONC_01903 [Cooperia oncophora]
MKFLEFGIGRFLVRTAVLFLTTSVASLLPNFGVFLDLVGSTSMTALTLVFPGLFSLYLEAAEKLREEAPRISGSCDEDDNTIPTLKQRWCDIRCDFNDKRTRTSLTISIG